MHQRSFPESYRAPLRISPATRTRVGQHDRVRHRTAAKKEGRSPVRGAEESDRAASLELAEIEVRAGAVLPGSGCAEQQATGAIPQPRPTISPARDHLVEPPTRKGHAKQQHSRGR